MKIKFRKHRSNGINNLFQILCLKMLVQCIFILNLVKNVDIADDKG